MDNTSQCNAILAYIKEHGSISAAEAMEHIGCGRLAARISVLRSRGYAISTEMVEGKNRHGANIRYARYRLEGANA